MLITEYVRPNRKTKVWSKPVGELAESHYNFLTNNQGAVFSFEKINEYMVAFFYEDSKGNEELELHRYEDKYALIDLGGFVTKMYDTFKED